MLSSGGSLTEFLAKSLDARREAWAPDTMHVVSPTKATAFPEEFSLEILAPINFRPLCSGLWLVAQISDTMTVIFLEWSDEGGGDRGRREDPSGRLNM